jgi:hypothetical protein
MKQNLNQPDYLVMPELDGVKVYKILQVSIDDKGNILYRCILENGETKFVPKELFDEVNK